MRHQRFQHNPTQQWGPPHQHPPHQGGQMHHAPNHMAHPAHAQHPHQGYMTRQITIEDAIGIAREQMAGEVVKAELERRGTRFIYEVEIISTQGPKYEIKIDASTGAVLEIELD